MREVASLAQVSPMTVSRVLRQSPGVSQQNRERVEPAIKALGYRRNELARSLRQGQRTETVGLIVTHLANPFYARLALGIESVLSQVGIRVPQHHAMLHPMTSSATCAKCISTPLPSAEIAAFGSFSGRVPGQHASSLRRGVLERGGQSCVGARNKRDLSRSGRGDRRWGPDCGGRRGGAVQPP
jgi:hypothetical protein